MVWKGDYYIGFEWLHHTVRVLHNPTPGLDCLYSSPNFSVVVFLKKPRSNAMDLEVGQVKMSP